MNTNLHISNIEDSKVKIEVLNGDDKKIFVLSVSDLDYNEVAVFVQEREIKDFMAKLESEIKKIRKQLKREEKSEEEILGID